ncbi:MAG: L-aspartate oxidase [Gloeomargaritaceae cyanobacterium C42_A2020_066]|nr:L-aspartate oxidase [Gloeomargaritaceae cyanobacterium C42_A2020_066]
MTDYSPPGPFDVLVVGGGAAGLYTALCLPKTWSVGLVTKAESGLSASGWAQGGIAAVIDPEDSCGLHEADTLRAGAGLSEPDAVHFLVGQAQGCIQALLGMGIGFDRYGEGLALTLEAAHSRPRILHAADSTGRELIHTLATQVARQPHIQHLPQTLAVDLWLNPQTGYCQGIRLIHQNRLVWVAARAVVLATGGAGRVFQPTTNPPASTGDGLAMAWRAGITLRDLEFVQFHPTALAIPGAPPLLVSEAVRGEGAHLRNHQGERFLFAYHPDGELAPRDVVSRAIFDHLQQTSQSEVWLDFRPIPPETIGRRFPNIVAWCRQWGVDVYHEPVPVAPAAHYCMGGVWTDLMARTDRPGLYAVGEVASTGVHGANRLASNSLLECLVFAQQVAQLSLAATAADDPLAWCELNPVLVVGLESILTPIQAELPRLMGAAAGIQRQGVQMEAALDQVLAWRQQLRSHPLMAWLEAETFPEHVWLGEGAAALALGVEVRNLLDVAQGILRSALARQESRGSHFRLDFPASGEPFHTLLRGDQLWKEPAGRPRTVAPASERT